MKDQKKDNWLFKINFHLPSLAMISLLVSYAHIWIYAHMYSLILSVLSSTKLVHSNLLLKERTNHNLIIPF